MSAFRDVVVLLPGITGSVLANAQGKEIWSPSAGAVWRAISSFGSSIGGLELAPGGDAGGVSATRLIPDITIVPASSRSTAIKGSSATRRAVRPARRAELLSVPVRLAARQPRQRAPARARGARLADALAHELRRRRREAGAGRPSMGGLVSRYFLECSAAGSTPRTLITLGTPHRGSVNAVDSIVNGVKKGIGPLGST
jgi:hypothetical protein